MHKASILLVLALAVPAGTALAEKAAVVPPPEIKKTVDAFAGKWKFAVVMTVPGAKDPVKFSEKMECKRVAGGRGVACTDIATVPGFGKMDFSHLAAWDPERKALHWFAVGSTGEVHDHTCHWKDDKTITCDPLKATLNGNPITEDVTITVDGAKQTWSVSIAAKEGVTKMEMTGKRTGK